MHCVLFVSIPRWMPFSSHSDRSSWRSECFLFNIFAMKRFFLPNSFTKSDCFCRDSGEHLPITTCHKASSDWVRLPGHRQESRGALVTLATSTSAWGCGGDLVACGWWKEPSGQAFWLHSFPCFSWFNKAPHHLVSDTEPSHQVWRGVKDLKQNLLHCQTSHLS